MRVPPPFLFMEDDRTRLTNDSELLLDIVDGALKNLHRHVFCFWRAEAENLSGKKLNLWNRL